MFFLHNKVGLVAGGGDVFDWDLHEVEQNQYNFHLGPKKIMKKNLMLYF